MPHVNMYHRRQEIQQCSPILRGPYGGEVRGCGRNERPVVDGRNKHWALKNVADFRQVHSAPAPSATFLCLLPITTVSLSSRGSSTPRFCSYNGRAAPNLFSKAHCGLIYCRSSRWMHTALGAWPSVLVVLIPCRPPVQLLHYCIGSSLSTSTLL